MGTDREVARGLMASLSVDSIGAEVKLRATARRDFGLLAPVLSEGVPASRLT